MSVWFRPPDLEALAKQRQDTLVQHLDISFSEIGDDYLRATMPVDETTKQPFGLLHGGASVALAETIGSVAANLAVDTSKFYCVGMEINANHLRPVRAGRVTGTGRPLHVGGKTQVWQIAIHDEADRLICVSRITLAVLDRQT
ncbi:MAG: hotdog fold thioesterase [Gammaproteobacteria bacterium]|nr:hotdog fold thioesterase [Gammaproteobacteria bacterium]MDH3767134.1 hotdog fold thioesterase [Gammaproteobacteria bacterium]